MRITSLSGILLASLILGCGCRDRPPPAPIEAKRAQPDASGEAGAIPQGMGASAAAPETPDEATGPARADGQGGQDPGAPPDAGETRAKLTAPSGASNGKAHTASVADAGVPPSPRAAPRADGGATSTGRAIAAARPGVDAGAAIRPASPGDGQDRKGAAAVAAEDRPAPRTARVAGSPDVRPRGSAKGVSDDLESPSELALGKAPARGGGPSSGGDPVPPAPDRAGVPLVDLGAKQVNRFTEGGCKLSGQILDADGRGPVTDALVEVWMGNRSLRTRTGEDGRFSFEGLVPGSRVSLWVTATPTFVQERIEMAIPSGRDSFQTSLKVLRRGGDRPRGGGIGVFLARKGNRTVVTGLTAWGPAEKGGIKVGDAILSIDGRPVGDLGPGAIDHLLRGKLGAPVTVVAETPGTGPRSVQLTRSGL